MLSIGRMMSNLRLSLSSGIFSAHSTPGMNGLNLIRCTVAAIISLFIVFACQKEVSKVLPSSDGSLSPDKLVITGFQGRVLDEHGKPVEGAIAHAAGKTAFTDKYGIFRLADVQTSAQFAFVSVEKVGYFKGSRTVIANKDAVSFVEIQLIPKTLSGMFSAAGGASIAVNNSATISFQPGAIITRDGIAYRGNVNVYATTIDPSSNNFTSIMPGDLRGVRADSNITALRSYGMITVSLTNDAGEELQLNKALPATISMTIPASLQGTAPMEIPLWHFDETDGKWKEDGNAVKTGNAYIGKVSHFSTWNYDVPQNFVFITMNVGGSEESTSPYTRVKITDKQNGGSAAAYTDSSGYLRTWVPKNVPLQMSIVSSCNDILLEKEIGPFTDDMDLGHFEVSLNKMIVVSGEVTDCEQAPLASGYVNLYAKGLFYRGAVNEGKFSVTMSECNIDGDSAELYAVDHKMNTRGESHYIILDETEIDAGVLSACGDEMPEQYAYFKLGDEIQDLVVVNDTVNFHRWGTTTHFWYTKFPNGDVAQTQISIRLTDTVPATFTNDVLSCVVNEAFYYPVEPVTITCTEYGQPGGYIAFRFSGRMSKDSVGPALPFSGAIRARREY
jgi:hypothetical protein